MIVLGSALSNHITNQVHTNDLDVENVNAFQEEYDRCPHFSCDEVDDIHHSVHDPQSPSSNSHSVQYYSSEASEISRMDSNSYGHYDSLSHIQYRLGQIHATPLKYRSTTNTHTNTHLIKILVNITDSNTHILKCIDQILLHIQLIFRTMRGILPSQHVDTTANIRKRVVFVLIDTMKRLLSIVQWYKEHCINNTITAPSSTHILRHQEYESLFEACDYITDETLVHILQQQQQQQIPLSFVTMCREYSGNLLSAVIYILLAMENNNHLSSFVSLLNKDLLGILDTCIQESKHQLPYVQGLVPSQNSSTRACFIQHDEYLDEHSSSPSSYVQPIPNLDQLAAYLDASSSMLWNVRHEMTSISSSNDESSDHSMTMLSRLHLLPQWTLFSKIMSKCNAMYESIQNEMQLQKCIQDETMSNNTNDTWTPLQGQCSYLETINSSDHVLYRDDIEDNEEPKLPVHLQDELYTGIGTIQQDAIVTLYPKTQKYKEWIDDDHHRHAVSNLQANLLLELEQRLKRLNKGHTQNDDESSIAHAETIQKHGKYKSSSTSSSYPIFLGTFSGSILSDLKDSIYSNKINNSHTS